MSPPMARPYPTPPTGSNRDRSFAITVPEARPAKPKGQVIALDIVYEDADLIVVNKPAGMVIHPAPGNPDMTLVNALIAHCGASLSGIGGELRPGIVHRLDKDTSGLIVAAKNDLAHRALSTAFAAHDIERAYLAVVWGTPSPAAGEIGGNIGRHPTDRKKMAIVARGGKAALTRYRVLRPPRTGGQSGRMPAGNRADPSNSRAHGGNRASGRGRSDVWTDDGGPYECS